MSDGGRCRHALSVDGKLKIISCTALVYQNGTNRVDACAYNSEGLGQMMATVAPLERARFKLSYGYKNSFFVLPANWTIFACYDTLVSYINIALIAMAA